MVPLLDTRTYPASSSNRNWERRKWRTSGLGSAFWLAREQPSRRNTWTPGKILYLGSAGTSGFQGHPGNRWSHLVWRWAIPSLLPRNLFKISARWRSRYLVWQLRCHQGCLQSSLQGLSANPSSASYSGFLPTCTQGGSRC